MDVDSHICHLCSQYLLQIEKYNKKCSALHANYSEKLIEYTRISDLSLKITGTLSPRAGFFSTKLTEALQKQWEAAEQFIFFVFMNFDEKYMIPCRQDWLRQGMTAERIARFFLGRINPYIHLFFYLYKTSNDSLLNFDLNINLFKSNLKKRERLINKIRNLFFIFYNKLTWRPLCLRRYLPSPKFESEVQGELMFSRKLYLDQIEIILEKKRVNENITKMIFVFLFGFRKFFPYNRQADNAFITI